MATTTEQREPSFQAERVDSADSTGPTLPPPAEGHRGFRIVFGLVLVALIAGGAWGAVQWIGMRKSGLKNDMLTAPVRRGDLVVTITEDGNLESAVNVDIKCEVAGGTAILWIVEDGKEVKEGEKLVELDSAQLEEQINGQRITFEKARAAKIQAEKDYAAAKLAVEEYLQGAFVQQLQDQDAQITIAQENLRSAQNTLDHSQRMFRKGYISALDLESQKFSVQRAQLELDSARTARDVLVKYTKEKTLQELESKRDSSEAQMRSEGASFDLEESRLKRLEAQMEHCIITAPASGMVVYANEQRGRMGSSQQSQIEEGAMVRERQTILRLPDLDQMEVKVNVHESKVETLGRAWKEALGQGKSLRANIKIQDLELKGTLTNIANQPEPSGWWTGNVKEYATTISIEGTPAGLRPGMTAECEILVDHITDCLTIPVAAVVEQRGGYFCWVKTPTGTERRPLLLGATNDQFVEVKDGVREGEEAVLNPRAMIAEARAVKDETEDDVNVDEKFGKQKKLTPGAPVGPGTGMKGKKSGGPGPGGPGGGASGKKRRSFDLMQFDSDGDGKVSKDEAPEQMQQFFDRMDENGDGFIDQAEVSKMRQRMRSGGGAGGPGGPGGGSGAGGGGKPGGPRG